MNKFSKYFITAFIAMYLCLPVQDVFADKYLLVEDEPLCDIPIYDGGVNCFDGKKAHEQEDLEEMEQTIRAEGYVLVNTRPEFDELMESFDELRKDYGTDYSIVFFESYLNPENKFQKQYSKVYVDELVLKEYIDTYRNGKLHSNPYLLMELDSSTVVIDYGVVYFHERIGADVSDEINDNIPEWCDTGYLCIESPVSVKITLFLTEDKNYYTFYVQKNEPFLVKIRQGGYNVVSVNSTETGDGEETLPFNDLIQITDGNRLKENAYILQLQQFVEKYNVQDIVIPDESEHSPLDATFPIDMSVERTTLETGEPESTEYQSSFALYLLGGIAVIFLILTVIFLIRKKSDTKQKENLP